MNMDKILEQIQNFDLNSVLSEFGESSHVLTPGEIIVFVIAAIVGILMGMLGLRMVRLWAGILGFLAGLAAGTYVSVSLLGLDLPYAGIPGLVIGIILAVLGVKLYQFGVFLTAWVSAGTVCQYAVRPTEWIWTAICWAIGLVVALLAIKFVKAVTILATAALGAVISGTSLYYLLPLKHEWFHILLCVALGLLGLFVQLVFVSGRRKRQNLAKAAEIRKTQSTENEVEKARALVDVLEEEEESGEPEFLEEDLFADDGEDGETEYAAQEETEEAGEYEDDEYFEEEEESEEYIYPEDSYPDEDDESEEYDYPDEDDESEEYDYLDEDDESEEYDYLDGDDESEEYGYLDDGGEEEEEAPETESDGIEYLDDDYLDESDELDDIEYLDDDDFDKN